MNTKICDLIFSDKAIVAIKKIIQDEKTLQKILRVGVKGGGCSGMSYVLEMDEMQPDDEEYIYNNLRFMIKPSHKIYLNGMTIEYGDGLNSRGFTFKNPNATKTCGCGTSFAV